MKNIPFAPFDLHKKCSQKWVNNNANKKIADSKAGEQKFCWRMNRGDFVKRIEDQSVAECSGESKKNFERKNEYKEWPLINHPVKSDLKLRSVHVRNVHRSFEIHTRSRPRIEKMRSGV